MIPAEFEYARPRDVGEVLRILSEHAGDAKVLSGGYSLLPLLKLRLASPALVVDIGHVAGLDGIAEQDGELRIGARVTHARLAADATIAARYRGRPRGGRRHRRPAGPQLGHDRRLLRPCRSVVRLAGGPHRHARLARLPQREGRPHDRRPRLLRRLLPDRHRAGRAARGDPHPHAGRRHGLRVQEAGAAGRRLRHRRGGRPAPPGGGRPHRPGRRRPDRRGRDAVRGDRRRRASSSAPTPGRRSSARPPRRPRSRAARRKTATGRSTTSEPWWPR